MLISANFESMPNVFVATLACAVFLFGYFNPLSYAGFARIRVLTWKKKSGWWSLAC